MLISCSFQVQAQEHVLKGRVVNEKNDPLIGATIRIQGTANGTVSDVDGKFILDIKRPSDSLIISYQGYLALTVAAGVERKRTFQLKENPNNKLNELVVVGYGEQKKVTVTGAVSSIPVEEIEKFATPSLSNAISGKVPGIISRQSSGMPGGDAAQVYIRGFGTLGNNAPLILVDGIERDMNDINPQEIAGFTILKDASATAVYGMRGANGVILITTKRGTIGRPKITFRTENAILTALRRPDYINGYEYASLVNEGLKNVGKDINAGGFSQEDLQKYKSGSDPFLHPNVDWTDVVLKKNTFQTISNLSITGGNNIIRYYTNVAYTQQSGLYKVDNLNNFNTNADLKRYNFRSNVDINVSKNLKMNLSLGGIIQKQNYPGNTSVDIFTALRRTTPIDFPIKNPDGSLGGNPDLIGYNPYGIATQSGYMNLFKNTLQGTFGTQWDLSDLVTKGLSIGGRFAYDYFSFNQTVRQKYFEVKQYKGIDEVTGDQKYNLLREELPLGYAPSNSANRAIYMEASINYNRTFRGGHSVTGLLLYNQRDYVDLMASSSILNLPSRRQGMAGRISYSYKDRYLLETDMGYNGSENFPKGKKFGFFPSVSAGWVISNEKFWNVDFITNLKIRGSYGQVGNDMIGGSRFLFLTTINRNGLSYPFGDNQQYKQGFDEEKIGNPDVTWEVATKSNLGLDLELFSGKVTLQVDAFKEQRKGILMQLGSVPLISGISQNVIPFANIGRVHNKGIDALLEVKNNTASGWFYSLRGNFTYAKNKIIEYNTPDQLYPYQDPRIQGVSIGQPFGLVATGFFKDQHDIDNSPRQTYSTNLKPGDIKYLDVNGDGKIDDYDRVYMGYPRTPGIMYGLGGTVAYKGFEVSLYFTGATRTSIFLEGPSMYPFGSNVIGPNNVLKEYYDNRWTPTNPHPEYPSPGDSYSQNNYRRSSLWMKDASYLRLRNAEVAYNLQSSVLKKLRLKEIKLFVNGTNLYTWDKLHFLDPESDDGTGNYPIQRSVNFGLQITF
jgi:TonB-linked SusC/RagA family outer membrane protein